MLKLNAGTELNGGRAQSCKALVAMVNTTTDANNARITTMTATGKQRAMCSTLNAKPVPSAPPLLRKNPFAASSDAMPKDPRRQRGKWLFASRTVCIGAHIKEARISDMTPSLLDMIGIGVFARACANPAGNELSQLVSVPNLFRCPTCVAQLALPNLRCPTAV